MVKIAGLASNRGRNLLHIADRTPGGAELSIVLTNEDGAPVIEGASERGIPTEVVTRKEMNPAPHTNSAFSKHSRATILTLSVWTAICAC